MFTQLPSAPFLPAHLPGVRTKLYPGGSRSVKKNRLQVGTRWCESVYKNKRKHGWLALARNSLGHPRLETAVVRVRVREILGIPKKSANQINPFTAVVHDSRRALDCTSHLGSWLGVAVGCWPPPCGRCCGGRYCGGGGGRLRALCAFVWRLFGSCCNS